MPRTMSDYQNLLRKSTALRKIPDGSGLYLFAKGPGRGAYWTFQYRDPSRFSKNGKPAFTSRGLGPFPDVTPKRAREAAERVRVELREGVTIIRGGVVTAMPRQARAAVAGKPFSEAVEEWLAVAATNWAAKTRAAASRALLRLPLASKPVNTITTDDVVASLLPDAHGNGGLPERQRQDVRLWLARVLDFAIGRGWYVGENPGKFEGPRRELWPRYKKSDEHHAAVEWADLPDVYAALPDTEAGRALRFLILTAARAGELERATWREITGENGATVWARPADHMKLGKAHSIPLAAAALKLLGEPGEHEPDAPLFKLASNAMLNALKTVRPDATVHGLRSTFRDWAGDNKYDRDAAEMSLAHLVGNAVERAYSRSEWLTRRRELLEAWSDWLRGNQKLKTGIDDDERAAARAV